MAGICSLLTAVLLLLLSPDNQLSQRCGYTFVSPVCSLIATEGSLRCVGLIAA